MDNIVKATRCLHNILMRDISRAPVDKNDVDLAVSTIFLKKLLINFYAQESWLKFIKIAQAFVSYCSLLQVRI